MNSKIRENTNNFIIEEAMSLFLEKSIVNVTMSDIAKRVGVGDATLYRYFQKKQNIVMQASVKLSKTVNTEYFSPKPGMTGFEQIASFFSAYELIYVQHPEYFKFINQLDAYITTENVIEINEYENAVNFYKDMFDKAYEKGLGDKTVKKLDDPDSFYYSTTHALLNLCKFLASKQVLAHDGSLDGNIEIKTLVDIILAAVKGE